MRSDVAELKAGQAELKADVAELKTGQAELRADVAELKTGQAELRSDVTELKTSVGRLESGQDELRRHMHVLHEDVVDRIKAIPTNGPTRAEMTRGFEELREVIGRRLDPLEAAVRRLSGG